MSKVTNLHNAPPLTDIVAHLRRLADQIEKDLQAPPYVMLIIPNKEPEKEWPYIILYGKDPGDLERSGLLAQAQAFMTINKVARAAPR